MIQRRGVRLLTGLLVLAAMGGSTWSPTLARYTDAATSTGSVGSATLDPPTSLAATGGTGVTLTWTPTVDTWASGYSVWRAATSGGTYTSVGTVTPRSATTTSDAPGLGTWYYVLRSTYASWTSANSNEASAIVVGTPSSTTYAGCVSNAADTTGAGDNNGYQTTPALACADGGGSAQDPDTGTGGAESCGTGATPATNKDRHRFWGFVTGLPGTVSSINGIRVRADLATNNNGGTTNLCAQLSWNGGTTWTTIKSVNVTTSAETTYTFGTTTDTWGRSWTLSELNATNFRLRIIDASSQTNKRYDLDYVAVSVTYTP